ncbi:MAG: AEC family transporter, partial [Planctomycetes bacterium]|nr:AEC family transporter [Planctomycetota bacterium]
MDTFDTLAPIFAITAIGWLLRRSAFLPPECFRGMNRLTFYVGLPALLFVKVATAGPGGSRMLPVMWVMLAALALLILIGYAASWAMRLPRRSIGAFVQACWRGNLAYVGLPVILYSLPGGETAGGGSWEGLAILAIAPVIPVYNVLGVLVLLAPGAGEARVSPWRLILRGLTNPLVIACIAGALFPLAGWTLPHSVSRTCDALGQMALPLALLGLGATLGAAGWRGSRRAAVVAAAIKCGLAPLIGWGVGLALGLGPEEMRIALIYLATPSAALSFVMAE